MPIDIKCDFCGNSIETKEGKGISVAEESIGVVEYMCTECQKLNLISAWKDERIRLEDEWQILEAEKRNFFENLLINQKREWFMRKKEKFFGTFYEEAI